MSSETDHPRQRTVAELLAAHGGQAPATGRRRRRREADETGGEAPVPGGSAPETTTALPPAPAAGDRGRVREPGHRTHAPQPQPQPHSQPQPQPGAAPRWSPTPGPVPPARPVRENPTDVIPRVRGRQPVEDLTSPLPGGRVPPPGDDGPSTMVGMAPVGAEDWHAARTSTHRGGTAIDGGPPLPAAPRVAGDGPAGLGGATDLRERDGFDDFDEYDGPRDGRDDRDDDGMPPPRDRRLGRSARDAAPAAWSAVLVQWLAGALGGAVLWVLFRFLWRALPVVAVAAAIVVVVGLVLVVRNLLHNDDKRTTVFAVLVGLLLTASPAVLVLLGR
jgi:hypothetical protein